MRKVLRADLDQQFLFPPSLDELLPSQHPARFVRDFVLSLDLPALGVEMPDGEQGGTVFHPELLLMVWLFGWMEGVRSTRKLEKACLRDLAFIWLSGFHRPDHNTLWRFWKKNKKAIKALFKRLVRVAVDAGLVGFALHALDGTKMPAASSMESALHRKTLLEQKKALEEQLASLDALTEQMAQQVDQSANDEEASYAMPSSMCDAEKRKAQIEQSLATLDAEDRDHLHPAEAEASMMKGRRFHALGYNAQAVVDHDSDLVVAAEVTTDNNDNEQLVPMLAEVKQNTGRTADETASDSGYFDSAELAKVEGAGDSVLVVVKAPSEKGPYAKAHFTYDRERDVYVCPRGELLPLERLARPNGKKTYEQRIYRCGNRDCPVRKDCTRDARGRTIKRGEHEEVVERQKEKNQRADKQNLMGLRKEIIERLFALQKWQDGFVRFTVRGLENVRAQWLLWCTASNLRKLYAFWKEGRLQLAG
jgi:transposase